MIHRNLKKGIDKLCFLGVEYDYYKIIMNDETTIFPLKTVLFEEIEVNAPNIIEEYLNGEMPLYHMDVYRLDGNTEGVGIEEYFNKGGVVIIEWADTIEDILPAERLDIKFKVVDENSRILKFIPHGQKYEEICGAVL